MLRAALEARAQARLCSRSSCRTPAQVYFLFQNRTAGGFFSGGTRFSPPQLQRFPVAAAVRTLNVNGRGPGQPASKAAAGPQTAFGAPRRARPVFISDRSLQQKAFLWRSQPTQCAHGCSSYSSRVAGLFLSFPDSL